MLTPFEKEKFQKFILIFLIHGQRVDMKRRLTYKTFLKSYENILPDNSELEFKTDNRLFEYSLVSLTIMG